MVRYMTSVVTVTQWREDWSSASVVNHTIVTDHTTRQPGFDLPRHTWSLMNRFRAGQGPCRANLHKWGLAQSPSCDSGQRQTMNHIVDMCPLTNLKADWIYSKKRMMTQSCGWNLQRLQLSRSKIIIITSPRSNVIGVSVCVFVCVYLSASISQKLHVRSLPNFLTLLSWPWFGPLLATLWYVVYFRFRWWRHFADNGLQERA